MRRQWFGDSRDYVKWSCIRREAGDDYFVLYIPMLTEDSFKGANPDPAVKELFDKHKDFAIFKSLFSQGFEVFDEPYSLKSADSYFSNVIDKIGSIQNKQPLLVFIDPDTGLQPTNTLTSKHLRTKDLEAVLNKLKKLSKVTVYQHARHETHWMKKQHKILSDSLNPALYSLADAYDEPKVSKDVCFFTITRN